MPELEEFLPIFPEETEETVMERVLIWLNDGVSQSQSTWIDPREGSMARTLLVPAVREMAVLYDRISVELPAAAHPLFAWGQYLDQWAIALGTDRLPATYADGIVRFTAPEGTVIPPGTEVGLEEGSEASYLTQEEATVPVTVDPPPDPAIMGFVNVAAVASEAGSVGNVAQNAVTAILSSPPDPEATVNNPAPMTGGTDLETDEALRDRILAIYASAPTGGNAAQYEQWVRALPGVGNVSITAEGMGPGTVVIFATTPSGDPVSDLTRQMIRDYLDPIAVEQEVTGSSTGGGPDDGTITVPTTSGFRGEGIVHMGTMADERIYTYTGLTGTHFTGVDPDPDWDVGDTVWQTGRGGGRSPIGHHVVVTKGTTLLVVITATVELTPGYGLGAAPGQIDLVGPIADALRGYIDALAPGEEIVLRRVESTILGIIGVHDIGSTKIGVHAVGSPPTSGSASNHTPDPTEIPTFDEDTTFADITPTITEGSIT